MKILVLILFLISCGSENDDFIANYEKISESEDYLACNRFVDEIESSSDIDVINQFVVSNSGYWHCKEVETDEGEITYVFLGCQDLDRTLWIAYRDLRYYEALGFEPCLNRNYERN